MRPSPHTQCCAVPISLANSGAPWELFYQLFISICGDAFEIKRMSFKSFVGEKILAMAWLREQLQLHRMNKAQSPVEYFFMWNCGIQDRVMILLKQYDSMTKRWDNQRVEAR
ncbi:UNVERIFIED_CONTAM: hypothetical protein K2H54_061268 [Gekko kuhli]